MKPRMNVNTARASGHRIARDMQRVLSHYAMRIDSADAIRAFLRVVQDQIDTTLIELDAVEEDVARSLMTD